MLAAIICFIMAGSATGSMADPNVAVSNPMAVSQVSSNETDWDKPDKLLANYSNYFRISGIDFIPFNTGMVKNHPGYGCVYISGSTGWLSTSVNLPVNASIRGLRIFWDISADATITTHMNSYYLYGETYENLVSVVTNSTTGRGSAYADLATPHTVSISNAYTIWVYFGTLSPNVRFCGARVYYYDPETITTNQILIK